MIKYLFCTHYVGDATHLIGCIVVVGPCALGVGRDQVIATDVADDAAVLLLCDHFITTEDELYKPAIFFHLMPQSLRIIAVDLHMTVKGLYFLCSVECIIGVLRLIIFQQVSGIVIGELCRHSLFRVLGQAVPRVIFIELLHALRRAPCPVACPVVVQFLRIGRVLHFVQLVQRVVGVACGSANLTFFRPVSVRVVGIMVVRQYFCAQSRL